MCITRWVFCRRSSHSACGNKFCQDYRQKHYVGDISSITSQPLRLPTFLIFLLLVLSLFCLVNYKPCSKTRPWSPITRCRSARRRSTVAISPSSAKKSD
ncbi:unnamed protein product [Brassica napus]|uniref:(rape) hypothetical protein n=1 Tax=Brassica napus TaxID=3708 RepID=A0A817B3E7_BRANA|nr:unnamed protein product [Brassica napus]